MTVKELVVKHMTDNGYSGLCGEESCGCEIEDLMPCGEDCSECSFGYKIIVTEENQKHFEDVETEVGGFVISICKEDELVTTYDKPATKGEGK